MTASIAGGVATGEPFNCPAGTEDTITLLTNWTNTESGNPGTALYVYRLARADT